MHRFFIPNPAGYQVNQSLLFPDDVAHQVRAVLRMRVGEQVVVLDNAGGMYEVGLTAVSRNQVTGAVLRRKPAHGEPAVSITLFQSYTRREKFEWILQKGSEVGVCGFMPIVTERSLVQTIPLKQSRLVRWQKIVREAAEQSRRGMIPQVFPPMAYRDALQQAQAADLILIAWAADGTRLALPQLWALHPRPASIALFIGPEGGFTEREIEDGRLHNAIPITLGSRILRTETAAIIAPALILHELGNLLCKD